MTKPNDTDGQLGPMQQHLTKDVQASFFAVAAIRLPMSPVNFPHCTIAACYGCDRRWRQIVIALTCGRPTI